MPPTMRALPLTLKGRHLSSPSPLLLLLLLLPLLLLSTPSAAVPVLTSTYLTTTQMVARMAEMKATCPTFMETFSIGKSVQGRDLLGIKFARDSLGLKPKFKYVGNMHGDETVGRVIMINLVEYMCQSYGVDPDVTYVLDHMDVYIIPSLNPDGYEITLAGTDQRENARNVDLNRNFPDKWQNINNNNQQPETLAMMDWTDKTQFVLSANFHGGEVVANYPWDGKPTDGSTKVPDDTTFRFLALTYSKNHATMSTRESCSGEVFVDGITQGYQWYPLYGGMQDFNYVYRRCMEITVELSCVKFPPANQLSAFWGENKQALFAYMNATLNGVSGSVQFTNGKPVADASIMVEGIDFKVYTDVNGNYWRVLAPGQTYKIVIYYGEYLIESKTIDLTNTKSSVFNVSSVDPKLPKPNISPASSNSAWSLLTLASLSLAVLLLA